MQRENAAAGLIRGNESGDSRNAKLLPRLLSGHVANGTVLDVSGITHGSYIGYYEVASYDTAALRQHRNRMRRDVTDVVDNQPLLLHLKALDK